MFAGNNYKEHNTSNAYYPNLTSLHSYVGLSAIIIYSQNYILGLIYFALQAFPLEMRKTYKPNHVLLGIISLFFALAAVVSGLMELYGEAGLYYSACGYDLTAPDTNPAANYCKLLANIAFVYILIQSIL